ncbi:MAG: hypothetical protein LBE13_05435 [Bacteroidales bacterium]|nr:hypothetical protein [Bacteroidales bacterium]
MNIFIISLCILLFSGFFKKYYSKLRHEQAGVNSTLVEIINGIYTIKAMNATKVVLMIMKQKNTNFTDKLEIKQSVYNTEFYNGYYKWSCFNTCVLDRQ